MLLHILSFICSDLTDIIYKVNSKTKEGSHNSTKNINLSIDQNPTIKVNMIQKVKINDRKKNVLNLKFKSYDKIKLLSGSSSNSDMPHEPLDLPVIITKSKRLNLVHKQDQIKIRHYKFLLYKLKHLIDKWDDQDFKFIDNNSKLKFNNKEDQKVYQHNRIGLYPWIKNQSCILKDFLLRTMHLIENCEYEQNYKNLMCLQIRLIYESMNYVQRILPFKENYKPLCISLIESLNRLTCRLPIIFQKHNLEGVFLDFFQTLARYHNPGDPIYMEIHGLTDSFFHKIFRNFITLDNLINKINVMIEVLKRSQMVN
ncbi:uncharacterized protein VNE69_08029 [Vairimorpha necatrix]|uniref:Uncharacterized protein n=1 Tax=Vairimorpha necatrix TaxID=6039 RepID=A0AAX4JE54_9MICR